MILAQLNKAGVFSQPCFMVWGLTTAVDACGIAPVVNLSHTPAHTQTHTHTLSHSFTLTLIHTHAHTQGVEGFEIEGVGVDHGRGRVCTHSLTHTHSFSLSHTHTLSLSHTPSLSHTHRV